MTEERKDLFVADEIMWEEETSTHLPPRKTGVLHAFNVLLRYFNSSITWIIVLMVILTGYLNIDLSLETYGILTLILTGVRYYVNKDDIETTIGLFVPIKEIKQVNPHVVFDLVIGLCIGYLVECIIINFLATYFLYIFLFVDLSTVQLIIFVYIVLVVFSNLSNTYRKAFGQED